MQTEYETRDRGVDDEERYATNDEGNNHEYVLANYREPIQRIYQSEPETVEEDYGGNFGAIQAYRGGFSSEKYDPDEYAKQDAAIRAPYEDEVDYDAGGEGEDGEEGNELQEEEEQEGRGDEEDEEAGGDRGRRGLPMEGPYRRDPDEDEEGYYVPREAREQQERGEREEEEAEEEGDLSREQVDLQRMRPRYRGQDRRERNYNFRRGQEEGEAARPPPRLYESRREEERAKRLADRYSSNWDRRGTMAGRGRQQQA